MENIEHQAGVVAALQNKPLDRKQSKDWQRGWKEADANIVRTVGWGKLLKGRA